MSGRYVLRRVAMVAGRHPVIGARRLVLPHCTSELLRPVLSAGLRSDRPQSYATRTVAADNYLVEVIKSEIEHELREEASKQGLLKGSAGPFELTDKAGTEEIILRRKFGSEEIAVTCVVESQYPDDDGEAEEEAGENDASEEENESTAESKPVQVLHLNVTITKAAAVPALEFECSFVRGNEEVEIETVSFSNEDSDKESADSEPQPYGGPDFADLDEKLQRAFHDLLKARGLTPKVATYALDYLTVKDHREYMRWLHNVETFFSSQ